MAKTPQLVPYNAFGCITQGIRDCICFQDDQTSRLLYPVGRYIARRSLDSNSISFIDQLSNVSNITSMAITRQRTRRFLSIGQLLTDGTFQLQVLDLKRQDQVKRLRQLNLPELQEKYTCVAFSYDSKLIGTVTGGIGVLWDWFKDKVIGRQVLQPDITRITINPKDSHIIGTSGPNHWKTWRVEEKMFKEQPMFSKLSQHQNFTDHDWIDQDTIVAVTDMNEGFIARSNQIIQYIEFCFGKVLDESLTAGASCLIGLSRGFIIASDEGQLAIWQQSETNEIDQENNDIYSFQKFWYCGKKQPIVSLALSSSEQTVGIALKSNDIGTCSLSQDILHDTVKFNIFCGGFHSGRVSHMDLAIQRPMMVTCSDVDATLRVWNYHSMNCELAKKLYVIQRDEFDIASQPVTRPLITVAFHPSGYYLAISFADKVRLFHLLNDELRPFRDIDLGNASILKFSKGGHMLAVGHFNKLFVYDAYTLKLIARTDKHRADIRDIAWHTLDKRLVTVGNDGAVFQYSTNNWESNSPERADDDLVYSCIAIGQQNTFFTVGMNNQDTFINQQHEFETVHFASSLSLNQIFFGLTAFKNSLFLATTTDGRVVNYNGHPSNEITQQLQIHQGAVTRITASPDGSYVFTAGEDGTIFMFEIQQDLDNLQQDRLALEGKEKDLNTRIVDGSLADIVLIERAQLDNFKAALDLQRKELDKIRSEIDQTTDLIESEYQEELNKKRQSLLQNIKSKQTRFQELTAQKEKEEKDYGVNLKKLEQDHNGEVDNLEDVYERKLAVEQERYRQLEHDKVEMRQHYQTQIKNIKKHNQEAVEKLENAFKEALFKAQKEYDSTKRTAEELKEVYQNRLLQQEDEHQNEVQDIKTKCEAQLAQLKTDFEALNEQKTQARELQSSANKQKEKANNEISNNRNQIRKQQQIISQLREQIKQLDLTIKEKEESILQKQNNIYDYKIQIKQLGEVKKILHQKQKDIVKEMYPKEEEIEMLGARLKNVRADLQKECKDNQELKRQLANMEDLINRLKVDNRAQIEGVQQVQQTIRSIINEIHHTVSTVDIKSWPDQLKKLYQNYVKEDASCHKKESDSVQALEHQLKHMQKSISGIRDSQKKERKRFQVYMWKRTQQNSTLIQELNKLRLDNKQDQVHIKQLKQQIQKKLEQVKSEGHVLKQPAVKKTAQAAPTPYLNYISKPTAVQNRLMSLSDKQRIIDLQNQLEEKREQNFYLKMEINQLQEMINKLNFHTQ